MNDIIDRDLNRHLEEVDRQDLFDEAVADEVELLECWSAKTLLSHMPGNLRNRLDRLLEEYAVVRVETRGFEVDDECEWEDDE